MKDYLGSENARNKQHAAIYERFLKAALPGRKLSVLVGHHITFELDGDLATENEIPSADCLMFDHDLMRSVFGDNYLRVMLHLVVLPCDERETALEGFMDRYEVGVETAT